MSDQPGGDNDGHADGSGMADGLRDRWPQRVAKHTDLRDRLMAAYDEPHRSYHDLRHLTEVLDRVDELLDHGAGSGAPRDTVRLAAWFHDAVYDTAAAADAGDQPSNEERSARVAEEELSSRGLPPALVAEVARLVRLTATHQALAGDAAGALLCDADLAILAADDARYAEYTAGVRREYAHLSDDAFRSGRATVLRGLVEQPRLFHTEYAATRWEQRARDNVARELAELAR